MLFLILKPLLIPGVATMLLLQSAQFRLIRSQRTLHQLELGSYHAEHMVKENSPVEYPNGPEYVVVMLFVVACDKKVQ